MCAICHSLQQQLNDKSLDMSVKLGALAEYRSHLHNQFCDRASTWQLQETAMDPHSGLMVVSTDGCDQSKFALPRDPAFRSSAGLPLSCNGG